jgi:hypothetical protein
VGINMSAAGRGAARIANDNYPTPAWATRRILEAIELVHYPVSGPRILEPCAGEGAISRVAREAIPNAHITAVDIRNTGAQTLVGSFDATQPLDLGQDFDLLITNPPFDVAHEIIQAQRNAATLQVYLLRSSFLEGDRVEAYRNDMPDVYLMPERPNFIASEKCIGRPVTKKNPIESLACGWAEKMPISTPKMRECPRCGGRVQRSTSDASSYAWFLWRAGIRKREGRCVILPSTPLAERKAA